MGPCGRAPYMVFASNLEGSPKTEGSNIKFTVDILFLNMSSRFNQVRKHSSQPVLNSGTGQCSISQPRLAFTASLVAFVVLSTHMLQV